MLTQAQKDRLVGFNASLSQRGVVVCLNSAANTPGVKALVETVDESSRKRLKVLDATVTHVVHVRRDTIEAELARLSLADGSIVSKLIRTDTGSVYRVQFYENDPQRPAVLFHCVTVEDV